MLLSRHMLCSIFACTRLKSWHSKDMFFAGLFNIGFIWHCVMDMEYTEFFILLQVIQEGYAGQSGLKGEKGDRVRNVKH